MLVLTPAFKYGLADDNPLVAVPEFKYGLAEDAPVFCCNPVLTPDCAADSPLYDVPAFRYGCAAPWTLVFTALLRVFPACASPGW